MKLVSWSNSRTPAKNATAHLLVAGMVFLLVLGLLVPQNVEARLDYKRAMPMEGDPTDGLDNDGGGGGGGSLLLPPEDGNIDESTDRTVVTPTLLPQFAWLDGFLTRSNFSNSAVNFLIQV